jgi:hypothetical protein
MKRGSCEGHLGINGGTEYGGYGKYETNTRAMNMVRGTMQCGSDDEKIDGLSMTS